MISSVMTQLNSFENRMLFFFIPSSTTSMPPERIIHSSRWSRYSRLKRPLCDEDAIDLIQALGKGLGRLELV